MCQLIYQNVDLDEPISIICIRLVCLSENSYRKLFKLNYITETFYLIVCCLLIRNIYYKAIKEIKSLKNI